MFAGNLKSINLSTFIERFDTLLTAQFLSFACKALHKCF